MSDRLQELTVFVRTAESGSFSRAGRELGLSQPSVSRIVNELEARLGIKLLLRTTRRVAPTEAGTTFLERAKQVLADLEAAEDAARGIDSLRGLIRVAMPVTFGVRIVIPLLQPFLAANHLLRLDFVIADARTDLIAEGVDVAIRLGDLTSSGFGARRLAVGARFPVASARYVAARGQPIVPSDLLGHDCIFGPGPASRRGWSFMRNGAAVSIELEPRISIDSSEGMMACVRAGFGVALVSEWMCRDDLASGDVVRVMGDFEVAPLAVHAVYPAGPHPSAKVRALVEYLSRELAR
ncbi:LysR family transcriptional regulator [Starkeya sp. ORNL1]|uniref:LysR family transcriptional regulator n=1 Tax=Starkeya sp. ORNL1 TaxID=2709380 RepID=UPI001462E81F|nr:LysR family transcriptional regulator [Starkeya sp. ORNL1]QJP16648.1 LysR family transcriptional regulator [Starkeya sp. ORNL1]